MIICPECQSENKNEDEICEQCGTSLTHKNCEQCGERVEFGVKNCPKCNAFIVDIYSSIVKQTLQESLSFSKSNSDSELEYLDSAFRYEISANENDNSMKPFFTSDEQKLHYFSVIDLKPLKKTSFDTLIEGLESINKQNLVNAGIPAMAFPYLTLTEFSSVPDLYDAWRDEATNQEFVVISPIQGWKLLKDFFANHEIPFLQKLSYLDKMAKLWKALTRVNCCQTLLEIDNFGLDEDDTFVVQKIIPDENDNSPELDKLLDIFLQILPSSAIQETHVVLKLLDNFNDGEITNIRELRTKIQTISQETELNSSEAENENEDLLFITQEKEIDTISDQFEFDEEEDGDDTNEEATLVTGEIDDQPTVVLPMRLLGLTDSAMTDIGKKRNHNEDCFAIDTDIQRQETSLQTNCQAKGVYVVCDGMGGHSAGEVASAMAVQTISNYFQKHWQDEFPSVDVIQQGILEVNENIYQANIEKGSSGNRRMGTTMVLTLIEGTKVAIAHVGDSRIYKVTKKFGLEQLTGDHSVAQMEIKRGVDPEIAYGRYDAYQLTQALGPRSTDHVHPDISILEVKEDSLFVLCSDGLSDNDLLEENWEQYLSPLISSKTNLNEGVSQLIDFANEFNGHDNITCLLIRLKVQPDLRSQRDLF